MNACLGGGDADQDVHQWERTVRSVLTTTSCCETLGISNHIRRGLLLEDDGKNTTTTAQDAISLDMSSAENDDDDDDKVIVLKGLPSYPLYKVLALRLCLIYNRELRKKNKKQTNNAILDPLNNDDDKGESTPVFLLIPAEEFGLQEQLPVPTIPTITQLSVKAIRQWFRSAGNQGVLTILGLRQTVGSDPRSLLPPSWSSLLQAAHQPHKTSSVLSVAARARAKHAHRSTQAAFFGIATGSPAAQNMAAGEIVERLLHEAVWINIHTFSGTDGKPALEVRVRDGYGARWVADWTHPLHPTDIEFRGFLEPQMLNGHVKGWKH